MSLWSKFADTVKVVGPVVLSVIPGVPPVLGPVIIHAISEAENLKGATGAQKKAHALNLINDSLNAVNAVKGETVLDPQQIVPAVSQGIDAVITTVNAVQAAHAEDVAEAAQTAPVPPPNAPKP